MVASAAAELSAVKLHKWIADGSVPEERKGFYGLGMGFTAKGEERSPNIALLKKLIDADAPAGADFRVGFDGVLFGGFLVAEGPTAIQHIPAFPLLANAKSAVGDVRHAEKALRFYYEYGPAAEHNPRRECGGKTARPPLRSRRGDHRPGPLAGLERPLRKNRRVSTNAKTTTTPSSAALIVGYLLVCPTSEAAQALAHLRQHDPDGVADAEKTLQALGGRN